MSDWDTTTRIGQKHKGGATPRETTVKGSSALNAAQRQGLITGTDKKYATGNAAKSLGSDGQRMTMIDRNNEGPVKPKEVGTQVADVIKRRRNEEPYKMTQKELAAKCNTIPTVIQGLENGQRPTRPKSSKCYITGVKRTSVGFADRATKVWP